MNVRVCIYNVYHLLQFSGLQMVFSYFRYLGHVYKVSKQTKTNNKTGDDMYVNNALKA